MKDYTRRGCTVPIEIETTTELIRQIGYYKDLAQSLADALEGLLEQVEMQGIDGDAEIKQARAALKKYRGE